MATASVSGDDKQWSRMCQARGLSFVSDPCSLYVFVLLISINALHPWRRSPAFASDSGRIVIVANVHAMHLSPKGFVGGPAACPACMLTSPSAALDVLTYSDP